MWKGHHGTEKQGEDLIHLKKIANYYLTKRQYWVTTSNAAIFTQYLLIHIITTLFLSFSHSHMNVDTHICHPERKETQGERERERRREK